MSVVRYHRVENARSGRPRVPPRFWKIHILHHADEHGVYGQWMLEELHHHGYRLSPGTFYPILARMAERGWLRAAEPKRRRGRASTG